MKSRKAPGSAEFAAGLGAAAAGLIAACARKAGRTTAAGARKTSKPRVVEVRAKGAVDARGRRNGKVLRRMLDAAVKECLQEASAMGSWKRLFRKGEKVGVKVNCLAGGPLSTCPELARAVADSLVEAGVEARDIVVFDRSARDLLRAGYPEGLEKGRCSFLGTVGIRETSPSYAGKGRDEVFSFGEVGSLVSRIACETDVLVNCPVLKDHDIAGISCALKNYFGLIQNPNKYHMDGCSPYIADVWMLEPVRGKTRINICDATLVQYHGGPGYAPKYCARYGALLVSTDPVALDAVGLALIERMRREKGLKRLEQEKRAARHIRAASDAEHALGVSAVEEIERVELEI